MKRITWTFVPLLLACNGGGSSAQQSPAQRYCGAVAEQADSCGTGSPCDAALVADCAQVTGLLNDGILAAAADCVAAGGAPLGCIVDSRDAIVRSPAHDAFAAAFCENCALGISGCEETLFGTDGSELAIAGTLILPLGDSLVGDLQAQCTEGFTCAAEFTTCAQTVLAQQVPTETVTCLIDGLISGAPPSTGGCGTSEGSGNTSDPSGASEASNGADEAGSDPSADDSSSDPSAVSDPSDGSDDSETNEDAATTIDPTAGDDDPEYPRGDTECPAGTFGPVTGGGEGGGGFCAPPCSQGQCPEGATGDATPACLFNPDSTMTNCASDEECFGDETCGPDTGICALPASHCALTCVETESCPDAMVCADGVCEYPA